MANKIEWQSDISWVSNVYDEEIKKSRDSNRIMDLDAINTGIFQYYMDKTQYPNKISELTPYLYHSLPVDLLDWEVINDCTFDYTYWLYLWNNTWSKQKL